jgi:hypothetical protein
MNATTHLQPVEKLESLCNYSKSVAPEGQKEKLID